MKFLIASLVATILFVGYGLSSGTTNSLAQTKYKPGISGRVTDPNGAVILGATIRLVGRTTKTIVTVKTDDNGEYAADLEPEVYDVEAEAPGMKQAKRKNILVYSQGRLFVDFMLKPKPAQASTATSGDR